MLQRGRKGPTSYFKPPIVDDDPPEPDAEAVRPLAPETLTAEEQRVWDRVVWGKPPDWYRSEMEDLLAQYCRHVVFSTRIARSLRDVKLDDEPESDSKALDWGSLQRAQSVESMNIARLMRVLIMISRLDKDGRRSSRDEPEVEEAPRVPLAPWLMREEEDA